MSAPNTGNTPLGGRKAAHAHVSWSWIAEDSPNNGALAVSVLRQTAAGGFVEIGATSIKHVRGDRDLRLIARRAARQELLRLARWATKRAAQIAKEDSL